MWQMCFVCSTSIIYGFGNSHKNNHLANTTHGMDEKKSEQNPPLNRNGQQAVTAVTWPIEIDTDYDVDLYVEGIE